jgi:replicative DNA helicase
MLSSRQIGRKLSYRMNRTTSDLYSSKNSLNDEEYKKAQTIAEEIKQIPIYYVDTPGSVENVRNTIIHFSNNEGKGKWIVIILDHTLLTRGRLGESERETLSRLQYMFMEMKKYNQNTIIQLSQMNRDIESTERIANSYMHFPMRKDLFGGDSVMQASDYVVVMHRPEMLNIQDNEYGPKNWPVKNLIYLHFLKNREGELGIIVFENNLKYNRIDETSLDNRKTYEEDFSPINYNY